MKVTTLLPTIPSHAFCSEVLSKHLSEGGKGGGNGLGRSWGLEVRERGKLNPSREPQQEEEQPFV